MPYASEWNVKALFNRSTIYIAPSGEGAPWRRRMDCEHDPLRPVAHPKAVLGLNKNKLILLTDFSYRYLTNIISPDTIKRVNNI